MEFIAVDREPGHFQQSPPPDQLLALCQRALGAGVEVDRIRELSSGFFNNTYVVALADGTRLILRIAPSASGLIFPNERFLMRREYAVQPFLAPACPLVPRTLFADFSHQAIDRDYVFQSFLEGEVWADVRSALTEAENNAIRRQLGQIARRINNVKGERFGFPYPDPGFGRWSQALIHFLAGMQEQVARAGLASEEALALLEWVTVHADLFDEVTEPRLLHGDLWPANILIRRGEGGPEIVGVLDSERALWGDPLFEWTYHLGTTHAAYWEGYGPHKLPTLRALAYKGIWQVLAWMEQLRFHGDAGWALDGLKQTLDQLRAHG